MESNILEEIGLTQGETKVYLALIKLGSTKTGPLASKSGVSSSKVYKILDRLEKKGLVGEVIKSKTKYFTAMEPKRVLDYLDEKEKKIQEKKKLFKKILPQLELEQQTAGQKPKAIIYEGFKAISNFYRNILDELKEEETYYVIGAGYGLSNKGTRPFFHNYHTQRAKKGIKVKMLANHPTRNNLEKTTFLKSSIRFLPSYFITDMTILFYKQKAFIFFLTKEPFGFLIHSEEAVNSFKIYFDTLWKIAKG